MTVTVAALFRYPMKSGRRVALTEAEITPTGVRGDREYIVVDGDGDMVTQREATGLALIDPADIIALDPSAAGAGADGGAGASVASADTGGGAGAAAGGADSASGADGVGGAGAEGSGAAGRGAAGADVGAGAAGVGAARFDADRDARREVSVWKWSGFGYDIGDAAADFVSSRLGFACRVLRFGAEQTRATTVGGGVVQYADGYPLLVTSTRSLAEVNSWLDLPVPMERFRPSIVLDGLAAPFVEDDIASVQVGDVRLDLVKLCGRCVMTTVDQDTAEKGREPLRTLGARRTLPQLGGGQEIMFGVNAVVRVGGTIRVGDEVSLTMHETPYATRVTR